MAFLSVSDLTGISRSYQKSDIVFLQLWIGFAWGIFYGILEFVPSCIFHSLLSEVLPISP